jgi:hypothetical protein
VNDRVEIYNILRKDVERATEDFEAAKRNFLQVCSDVPNGIPHPNGARRLQKTAYAQNAAMRSLAEAMHRLNAFLLNGAVPADLKERDGRSNSGLHGRADDHGTFPKTSAPAFISE